MVLFTQNYNEYTNSYYYKIEDEKLNPDWFYLLSCDECEKHTECTKNICSQHLSHRISVTCNLCQNSFRTFNAKEVRCSVCFWSIEGKF